MLIQIPQELTISHVADVRAQWLRHFETVSGHASMDGSAVIDIDGAGLQLLMAVARELETTGHVMTIKNPSAALLNACAAIGWTPSSDEAFPDGDGQ